MGRTVHNMRARAHRVVPCHEVREQLGNDSNNGLRGRCRRFSHSRSSGSCAELQAMHGVLTISCGACMRRVSTLQRVRSRSRCPQPRSLSTYRLVVFARPRKKGPTMILFDQNIVSVTSYRLLFHEAVNRQRENL